ncbi:MULTISPECIES: flagellar export chaperone FliS [Pseudomonadaceae]|jgi:flagellar secretion chaperone FliS|uniref:Flagellar secretion chaperone FliS n=1 Tax=Metapseudomonas otitidis TaxID=319939 RepID=A0A1I0T5I7_9GAMM|nr:MULTISPECIES: flagellar export chaperone FliS [Pseudomonas]MDL5591460.1 flagellar export chaperone FliS [Bacillus subtilis]MBO2927483.1 flagellar export chaperone FliS [Pseudomonas otitidis]MCP1615571.1 flagellar protein FliS [Pseudomonas otitidis]MDG9782236.1 flagellar export chaperone FliS [Pseudomonas otitidis]MDH0334383.1 flagellar export chaperone FliS [Pseudomonas otitidis]
MNAMMAMQQYQRVNVQAQVAEASPHRLIQMLMEGGLERMAQAQGAMMRDQAPLKGELISKSIAIIGGLREALDPTQGGEIAMNLDRLYEYMIARLIEANKVNDPALVNEVAGLLREVKSGWDAIAPV